MSHPAESDSLSETSSEEGDIGNAAKSPAASTSNARLASPAGKPRHQGNYCSGVRDDSQASRSEGSTQDTSRSEQVRKTLPNQGTPQRDRNKAPSQPTHADGTETTPGQNESRGGTAQRIALASKPTAQIKTLNTRGPPKATPAQSSSAKGLNTPPPSPKHFLEIPIQTIHHEDLKTKLEQLRIQASDDESVDSLTTATETTPHGTRSDAPSSSTGQSWHQQGKSSTKLTAADGKCKAMMSSSREKISVPAGNEP